VGKDKESWQSQFQLAINYVKKLKEFGVNSCTFFCIVLAFEWRKQKIFLIKNGNRDRFSKSTGFQNLSF